MANYKKSKSVLADPQPDTLTEQFLNNDPVPATIEPSSMLDQLAELMELGTTVEVFKDKRGYNCTLTFRKLFSVKRVATQGESLQQAVEKALKEFSILPDVSPNEVVVARGPDVAVPAAVEASVAPHADIADLEEEYEDRELGEDEEIPTDEEVLDAETSDKNS